MPNTTPNTIQLKLLENRLIVAEINGRNYAYEGGYKIIAGEENATEFEISSIPAQYADFSLSVAMTNSRGQNVEPPEIADNKFMLPIGMAVAGYGQLIITAHGVTPEGKPITVPFFPFKIPVANTNPNWTSGVINGTITIEKVETLPPNKAAYAKNVGTATDAIIILGIPQGKNGQDGKDALPIKILGETYYNPALPYTWDTTELLPLPNFIDTEAGTAYLVDDNEVKGQYDLYIHNHEADNWVIINNWGGIPGQQGEQGIQGVPGVGIDDIEPDGVDANGGNIYQVVLTDGNAYSFTAPKGPIGATGNGVAYTIVTYATSTSGTTIPEDSAFQSTIPTVAQGSYLWTRTIDTYTNGMTNTSYSVARQGVDGEGFNSQGNYPNASVGKLSTARTIDGIFFDGTEDIDHYATCSTASSAAEKVVAKDGFTLSEGARLTVYFTYANTVNSPTLNVNGTGAKTIKADGDTTYVKWLAGAVMEFVYDGTNWVVMSGYQLSGMRVGALYFSNNSTSPATLYGGSWTAITAGNFLKAITSGTPSYKDAGLPNIVGTLEVMTQRTVVDATGAFLDTTFKSNSSVGTSGDKYYGYSTLDFEASKSNSIYGASDTVTPKNRGAYMWYRTA